MTSKNEGKRVAIVGGGVAGLSAAWHLLTNTDYDIQLFESEDRLGGHAYTLPVQDAGVDVDVGFMVFNDSNYPNMVQWFKALEVETENSDMSLSVSLDGGKTVEWNSDGLNGLFANRSQALSPSFYKFLADMIRFNEHAPDILGLDQDDPRRVVTLGQYLRDHDYSEVFCNYYLLPMVAAVWSMGIEEVLQFPAEQLIGFFCNHKLLQILGRPQWKTVANRSQSYTLKMKSILGDRANLSTPIVTVKKKNNAYELFTSNNKAVGVFDHVVFACHAPTTSSMLQKSGVDAELVQLLEQVEYADNAIYIHSDPKLMPSRKRAWASWNCIGKSELLSTHNKTTGEAIEGGHSGFGAKSDTLEQVEQQLEGEEGRMKAVYVTYWLNRLQNLETDKDVFVSLNPHQLPDKALTHERIVLSHPQFNASTVKARDALNQQFQGRDGLWFCGAWQGHGFHEDGCYSGFNVATQLSNVALPWCAEGKSTELILSPPNLAGVDESGFLMKKWKAFYHMISYTVPVNICKRFIYQFLDHAIKIGMLNLKFNDGSIVSFGDGTPCGGDDSPVTIRVFEPWFFVKTAFEYDLGLARSYMAGFIAVEPLPDPTMYNPVVRPFNSRDETSIVLGDPIGLTRLFLLLIDNRDHPGGPHVPRKSGDAHWYSHALTNASGLVFSKIGSLVNFLHYKLTMDNSERGGSLKNIRAHYDLSNDLFTSFLDKETLMYSSAIYDAVKAPTDQHGLVFRGTLEEAQWRKLDTLLDRAQVRPGQTILDIGFGWGGLSLHAAKKYGCKVYGITLSVEQKALAEERVVKEGLGDLITFEVVDYRVFARRPENCGKFDRVLSCEMIEAVGHDHLGKFFWAVEQLLAQDGILVMEAITTPEQRYETYRRTTDFINTVIFPGGCAPSLHALVDAAYKESCLTLEHIDNIGLHYAQTLAEWRRRFNANEDFVRKLGFDDVFFRVWNYYFCYCEAGFCSQTVNCLILVFSRQGCTSLVPLCESRSVTQAPALSNSEIKNWLGESK